MQALTRGCRQRDALVGISALISPSPQPDLVDHRRSHSTWDLSGQRQAFDRRPLFLRRSRKGQV